MAYPVAENEDWGPSENQKYLDNIPLINLIHGRCHEAELHLVIHDGPLLFNQKPKQHREAITVDQVFQRDVVDVLLVLAQFRFLIFVDRIRHFLLVLHSSDEFR